MPLKAEACISKWGHVRHHTIWRMYVVRSTPAMLLPIPRYDDYVFHTSQCMGEFTINRWASAEVWRDFPLEISCLCWYMWYDVCKCIEPCLISAALLYIVGPVERNVELQTMLYRIGVAGNLIASCRYSRWKWCKDSVRALVPFPAWSLNQRFAGIAIDSVERLDEVMGYGGWELGGRSPFGGVLSITLKEKIRKKFCRVDGSCRKRPKRMTDWF